MRSSVKLLDSLVQQTALSEDGKLFAIEAFDPFHDSDLRLVGYPDLNTASTAVQLIKFQVQLRPPTTVVAGNNWDASLVLFPTTLAETVASVSNTTGALVGAQGVPAYNIGIGGFEAIAGVQGARLWPGASAPPDTSAQIIAQQDPQAYTAGPHRIIGAAFEVVNTTAEINKQGQVMVWRLPSKETVNDVNYAAGNSYRVKTLRSPPGTISDAQLLYGSRSWAASEGAYVVARQNQLENDFKVSSYSTRAITSSDPSSTFTNSANQYFSANTLNNTQPPADSYSPFDISGVHFTGLSYATSLTVNIRWIIERLPGPLQNDLVVMSVPAPCYDPLALQLLAHGMCRAPPGVMLKENPMGEWFRDAVTAVADWAPKIGNALGAVGVPLAGTIGNAVGFGASALKSVMGPYTPPPLPGSASGNPRRSASRGRSRPVARLPRITFKTRSRSASRSRSRSRGRAPPPAPPVPPKRNTSRAFNR
jgi:hypothetical protein